MAVVRNFSCGFVLPRLCCGGGGGAVCVARVLCVFGGQVEIMQMRHKDATDSTLVRGIVMDHGARHPDMPRNLKK